jgi:outer membrane immunogenic protein
MPLQQYNTSRKSLLAAVKNPICRLPWEPAVVMLVSGSTRFPWGAQMKKTTLLAGVAAGALAIAAPASAADLRMPVKAAPIAARAPYFSWTGCYIGAHVGWGWGRKEFSNGRSSDGTANSFDGNVDTSGAIFGGQLGCNYQFQGNWVLGIDGAVSGADINGFDQAQSDSSVIHVKNDFLASVTGRIGWNGWNPAVLFYFKGGVAWAHDRYSWEGEVFGQQDRTGWTVGLGAEWAFAPSWSAFVEWDHYDFGTDRARICDSPVCDPSGTLFVDVKQRIETVKIGLNYRFSGIPLLGKSPGY